MLLLLAAHRAPARRHLLALARRGLVGAGRGARARAAALAAAVDVQGGRRRSELLLLDESLGLRRGHLALLLPAQVARVAERVGAAVARDGELLVLLLEGALVVEVRQVGVRVGGAEGALVLELRLLEVAAEVELVFRLVVVVVVESVLLVGVDGVAVARVVRVQVAARLVAHHLRLRLSARSAHWLCVLVEAALDRELLEAAIFFVAGVELVVLFSLFSLFDGRAATYDLASTDHVALASCARAAHSESARSGLIALAC